MRLCSAAWFRDSVAALRRRFPKQRRPEMLRLRFALSNALALPSLLGRLEGWVLGGSFLLSSTVFGQSYVLASDVPVLGAGGQPLVHAWAGGLNNPQFSNMDVNGDGIQDLFVFDRQGDVPLVFLGDGVGGAEGWQLSPVDALRFPPLRNWAYLRDVNCDGIEDLVTSRQMGIAVYRGERDGGLRFLVDTARLSYVQSGFLRYVGVTEIDIPALEDVDGDGDRDVLTFNLSGGYVEWYVNRASENGDPCGPIDLEFADGCWGRFYESGLAKAVELDTCLGGSPVERPSSRSGVHAGSTLMAFDEDGDGDLELVLGDLSFDNLNRLLNGGSPEAALMVEQDTLYPRYDQPYQVHQYPAPFYADADQDGRPDLLVAPNSSVLGKDINNVAFYRDVGTAAAVNWEFQREDFLVGDMIDVGRGANPVFFDDNSDGLLDLVIGNSSYTLSVGTKVGQLALYRNTGTATAPAFELISTDYAGISLYGFENVHPTFGDVDGDGDQDMVIGEENGLLHLFVNNPLGGVANFSLSAPGWQGIDPGKTSTPLLVDLDRDGDLDLLVGERNGNLNYYRNDGTPAAASFTYVTETFGGIVLASGATNIGEVQPWVLPDPETGSYRLYVGERTGRIWRYDNWESDLGATFALTDSTVGNIDAGDRSRVAAADLDNDGLLELVVGNMRGGLSLYREGEYVGLGEGPQVPELQLWPNPAGTTLFVHTGMEGPQELVLLDLQGRICGQWQGHSRQQQLALPALPDGLYRLLVRSRDRQGSVSVVILGQSGSR